MRPRGSARKPRRKRGRTAELLLDTTYLLPVFGISVGLRGFESRFDQLLGDYEVLFNPVSLVEAKWIVLKGVRKEPAKKEALLASYRAGLKVVGSDGRLGATPLTDDEVEEVADGLHEAGMNDYFDRMIYAAAVERGCALLTEDREMLTMGKGGERRPSRVLSWNQLWSSSARDPFGNPVFHPKVEGGGSTSKDDEGRL